MRFVWRNVFLCAGLSVAGCGFAHKPYDNNPLLRDGRAVWPARGAAPAKPAPPPTIEPQQPPLPSLTSRPG